MALRLKLFASIREQTGIDEESIAYAAELASVAGLREHLRKRGPAWHECLDPAKAVRAAVNQRMVSDSEPLKDGDEVAFFPPVTGG